MALFYPDILEHNNPNKPLMDDGQLAGSYQIVANLGSRDALPLDKRKIGMCVAWLQNTMPILKKYIGPDTTDPEWVDPTNWVSISYPFFNYDITEVLLANATTTFIVGDRTDYATFILYYQMVRDTVIAVGQIEIIQNYTGIESPTYFTFREVAGTLGLVNITTALNVDNVEVSVQIDNSSATDVTMNYNLIRKPFVIAEKSWVEKTGPITTDILSGVSFANSSMVVAVGNDGADAVIFCSIDGGSTWTQQTSPVNRELNAVFFIDGNNGWACGNNVFVIRTSDGGMTWTTQYDANEPIAALNAIHFIDANIGWAVGHHNTDENFILYTINAGLNWVEQTSPELNQDLKSVFAIDANNAWAVGSDGTGNLIINTTDGGTNWNVQTPPVTTGALYSVFFINANVGWAVGSDGSDYLILKTVDGGANWTTQTSPVTTNVTLHSVYFVDVNTGWAVGQDGAVILILNTIDGGANWLQQTSPVVNKSFLSVAFYDEDLGVAVGIKTINGNIVIEKYSIGLTYPY